MSDSAASSAPASADSVQQEQAALLALCRAEETGRAHIAGACAVAGSAARLVGTLLQRSAAGREGDFLWWFLVLTVSGCGNSMPRQVLADIVVPLLRRARWRDDISMGALLPLLPTARSMLPAEVSAMLDRAPAFRPLGATLSCGSVLRAWSAPAQSDASTPLVASAATAASAPSFATVPVWLQQITEALAGGRDKFSAAAEKAVKQGVFAIPPEPGADGAKKPSKADKERARVREATLTLAGHLSHLLGAVSAGASADDESRVAFDTSQCRVLHSKERVPVMLCMQQQQHQRRFILKTDDDLRIESLAMLVVRWLNSVFERENLRWGSALVACPCYDITAVEGSGGATAGLVECLHPSMSVHELRLKLREQTGDDKHDEQQLQSYLVEHTTQRGADAEARFVASFVGASVAQHVLALKDRHNANILLCEPPEQDAAGVLWANIDFSFAFGRAPGGMFSLETAPFRMPDEIFAAFFEKSKKSGKFAAFSALFSACCCAVREHFHEIATAVSAISPKALKKLSCVPAGAKDARDAILGGMMKRLLLFDDDNDGAALKKALKKCTGVPEYFAQLCHDAAGHSGTKSYDAYQKSSNGIL